MTPNEQAMWHDIAEAIEPYCVNGAGMIRDHYEQEDCEGFSLLSDNNVLRIQSHFNECITNKFPIEEGLRIFNKDKPGYFEGMPIDGNEA